jgi:hypothetical protein
VANPKIPQLRAEIIRNFPRIDARQVERALAALVDGGAADLVVGMSLDAPGRCLDFCDQSGRRLAWLRVDHLDIVEALAPDYALLDGHAEGIRRVPFPGYGESSSPARERPSGLPCQVCFNFHDSDEDCF